VVSFPHLVRTTSGLGEVRYALGDRLVDRYLEFVAGRARPNTLRAVAFDLKTFFTVVGKGPVEVTAADVFEFLAHQRGDRSVIRLADRESGLSARIRFSAGATPHNSGRDKRLIKTPLFVPREDEHQGDEQVERASEMPPDGHQQPPITRTSTPRTQGKSGR
jgi:hypothetical protein